MKHFTRSMCCFSLMIVLWITALVGCGSAADDGKNPTHVTITPRAFNTARAEFSMVFHLSENPNTNSAGATMTSMFKGAFTVEPRENGGYCLTLPELQVSITSGDAALDFNAGNTYTGEMAVRVLPFRILTETVFTAEPNEAGRLVSLAGFEDVLTKIQLETAPYGDAVTQQSIATLNEFLNENTLCYLLDKLLCSVPQGTIAVGTTQVRQFEQLAPYAYTLDDTVVYTGRSGNADVFANDGKVQSASAKIADELLAKGYPYYEMTGTTAGTCTLYTTGDLIRSGSNLGTATGICYFPDKTAQNGTPVTISRQLTYSVRQLS